MDLLKELLTILFLLHCTGNSARVQVFSFCSFGVKFLIDLVRRGERMYVKVELKRYRNLKSTGKIVMNVRFVAYYQLMQICQV
jgi:hypothetical protein